MDILTALFLYVFGTPTPPVPVELQMIESFSGEEEFCCDPAFGDCGSEEACEVRSLPKVACAGSTIGVKDVMECCLFSGGLIKCCNNYEKVFADEKVKDDGLGPIPPRCTSYN